MTAPLPAELRPVVNADPSEVVCLVDSETNRRYVLVPAEVYDRLQPLIWGDNPREAYPLIDRVMADDDANDPLLAGYQSITRKAAS